VDPFFRSMSEPTRFVATASTRGPWSNDHQHAGPPSALLARACELLDANRDKRLARITCEMLRPIPIGNVMVETEIEKAGKKTTLMRARLVVDGGVAIDARLLFVRMLDTDVLSHDPKPSAPETCEPYAFTFFRSDVGYHTAVELRLVRGVFGSGAMACWMRQRVPLVDDETPSGAQRVLVVADAGSGVSAGLDLQRYTFLNADLSVHLAREPRTDWVLMDAKTSSSGNGRALASTALFDEDGAIGHGLQSLVVESLRSSS
jgi:hypothetical protein